MMTLTFDVSSRDNIQQMFCVVNRTRLSFELINLYGCLFWQLNGYLSYACHLLSSVYLLIAPNS